MDLEDKIGQMLVFGWQGVSSRESRAINIHAHALVDEFRVGGIILMGRNIGDSTPGDVAALTEEFQSIALASDLAPLFIGVDQEGGRVSRFGPPNFRSYPSAWEQGLSGDSKVSFDIARAIGEEMDNVGVNWVFAPVLDVNNNPDNPVIGDRSFGSSAQLVSKMGAGAVRGFQDGAGVLACGKHFPGHGDTNVDSHEALPVIRHGRERLDTVELVPFRGAIATGVGSVMASHIVYESLDDLPASLSSCVLRKILREELGFNGIIISDCLEMKGVASIWGSAEAAVLAAIAGADMLLACHTYKTQQAIRAALINAVHSGRLSEFRGDDANERIETTKARWVRGVGERCG